MSSSDVYHIEILRNIFSYVYRYTVPVLYLTGNIGNLLSVFIFLKRPWRKNVCVFYFLVCLFFNLCFINSTILGAVFTISLNIKAHNSNRILCKLFFYVSYVFTRLFPTILILASIDRLLISSQNINTRLYSSRRLAYFSISIGTLFWIIFYIHALVKVDLQQTYPSVFVCYYETSGFYFKFATFSSLTINVTLSIVLIILSILTFKNVRQIRAIPRQQRQQFRSMNKKDFQLLRCLYVHDIVYMIFSLVPSVVAVYLAITRDQTYMSPSLQATLEAFLNQVATFVHHIPYCISFFIFISISKTFRQEMKELIWKTIGKEQRPVREDEKKGDNIELHVVVQNVVSSES